MEPPGADEDEVIGPLPVGEGEKEGKQRREKVGPINGGKFECYSYKCPPREGIEFCFFYAVLPYEKVYLDGLPCAEMYEKSYMHRDIITHVLCTKLVHLDIFNAVSTVLAPVPKISCLEYRQ